MRPSAMSINEFLSMGVFGIVSAVMMNMSLFVGFVLAFLWGTAVAGGGNSFFKTLQTEEGASSPFLRSSRTPLSKRVTFVISFFIVCALFGNVHAQNVAGADFMSSVLLQNVDDIDNADDFDDFLDFEEELQEQVDIAHVPDPLEPLNRGIWWVNDKLYLYILEPISSGYSKVIPKVGRQSIANVFDNLQAPERVINNLLQMKFSDAGTELKRFLCNSTIGVLGLRDPAARKDEMQPKPEDFGQTLGHYGVKPIMALQLPLLGPSNLRDAVGLIPDMFLNPIFYVESFLIKVGVKSEEVVNDTSLCLGVYEDIKKEHLDMYNFLQDAYEQNRLKKIKE